MRKKILILPLIFLASTQLFAQTAVEFVPTAGYTFGYRTDYDYNTYNRIADGLNLGGSINFNVTRNFGFEVLYSHMNTTAGWYTYDPHTVQQQNDLMFDYIMAGPVISGTIPNTTVRPFFGALLGAAIMTPDANSGYSQDTKFAVGLQLGMNIYCTPRFGFQIKGQLLSPVDAAGSGIFVSNYGVGGGLDTYSSFYQFSLNAGVIIGLGRVLPSQQYHPAGRPRPHYRRYYYY